MNKAIDLEIGTGYAAIVSKKEHARAAIAKYFGIDPNFVFPAIGATEGISRVVSVIESLTPQNRTALIPKPEYWRAVQRISAAFNLHFHAAKFSDKLWINTPSFIDNLRKLSPDLVYISNPNNPTGNLYNIDKIIAGLPARTTLLIDATLVSINDNVLQDRRKQIKKCLEENADKRIFVVGSLSKTHDVPELRFGWILAANPELYKLLASKDLVFPAAASLDKGTKIIVKQFYAVPKRILASHRMLQKNAAKLGYVYIAGDTLSSYALIKISRSQINIWRKKLHKARVFVCWGEKMGLPKEFIRLELSKPANVKRFLEVLASGE